jgi:hypothetical protein
VNRLAGRLWITILVAIGRPSGAAAEVIVHECYFPSESFEFVVTTYDDGSPSRVGIQQGVGDLAKSYFDDVTKAWVIVEFIDQGKLPSTLTTILPDGEAFHSRHTLDVLGNVVASQMKGTCRKRTLP